MPNHYYIISEVQFFANKDDEGTWEFVSETGIDLNQICESTMPTVADIKKAFVAYGLKANELLTQGNSIELSPNAASDDDGLWIVFTDVENDHVPVNMFEVGSRSNPDLVIKFIQPLCHSHGNFLYYCDSGSMSLITKNKVMEQIKHEIDG